MSKIALTLEWQVYIIKKVSQLKGQVLSTQG